MKFWLRDFNNYFDKYPLPEAELLKAEEILGYKLPKAYRNFLLEQNGGNIRFNAYKLKEGTTIEYLPYVEFSYIAGVGESEEFGNILNTPEMIEEWNMPKELILINGDGQIWIALDYRNNKEEPAVTYIDNETGEDIVIADNFDEFVQGLYAEDDVFFFLLEPDEAEARLLKRPDEELIEAIQKGVQSKDILVLDDALNNLVINRDDDIAEKYVLGLIEHRTLWIREHAASYFYYAAKIKTIEPAILERALKKIEKDPALEHYVIWVKDLED